MVRPLSTCAMRILYNNSLSTEHPSTPNNLSVILDDTSAHITWDAPINLGSPAVSYYSLVISDDNGTTHTNETLPASGVTEFTVTDLLPLTNYTLQLRAVSQFSPVLVSSPAIELNFTTNNVSGKH